MAKRWYVVHAYSGYELAVKKALEDRIQQLNMQEYFDEILVPTEEVVEVRSGQKRKSDRKFYPCYVLIKMEMTPDTGYLVRRIPKVLGFIGGTVDKPAPLTDQEADTILNKVKQGADKPRPKTLFEIGEVVRIIDGFFADFNGSIEEVNYDKNKLRVSVLILGRSTPVDLEFRQVEKVN